MGQISACKGVAREVALTVKLSGVQEIPWLEDTEGTAQQQCHILGAGIIMQ